MFGQTKLTEEQKAARKARKEIERRERNRLAEQRRAREAADRQARFEAMPEYIVTESREVRVKASTHADAIALAAAAFKEGQDADFSIRWGRPWGIEGDTIGPITSGNIKAKKDED